MRLCEALYVYVTDDFSGSNSWLVELRQPPLDRLRLLLYSVLGVSLIRPKPLVREEDVEDDGD